MERAPLRPVPSHRPSPVDPAEAIRHVSGELSALDAPAAEALALTLLAGCSRDEVAVRAALSGEQVAEALARGRKALRRRLHPLPGSGWCERAERLISDRIDDALEDPGPARLDVHLANCSRCVEHQRRLAQAEDALVAGFVESTAPPAPPEQEPHSEADDEAETPDEPAPAAPAALRIVDAARLEGPQQPGAEASPVPDEAATPAQMPEPPALGADPPVALPPADDAPA
ncbi:MAG: zf-HC2 domain-containing protein, partial [Actinomycetota bacterium]|nr:zf-HC2 domain-containing protein [Actinomycetota bacterium]